MGLFGTYSIWAKSEKALADADASAIGGRVEFKATWVRQNQSGANEVGAWAVYPPATPSAPSPPPPPATGGSRPSGSGGARAAAGPQAMAATMANQPTITGGGQGFSIGASQIASQGVARDDDFRGINTLDPDNKLRGNWAPRGVNWDGFRRMGSRCIRSGIAKLDMDRDSATASGGGSLSSEYRGLSLCNLPASNNNADQLLIAFHDKDAGLGTAPGGSNSQTSFHIMDAGPRWGRPRNLSGMRGPTLTLADQGSQVLRVTAIFDVIPTAQAELREQSVKAITICVVGPQSGATPRYPLDPDGIASGSGNDGTGSFYFFTTGPSNVLRRAWDGSSTNYDCSLVASGTLYGAGKYWVACFAHGYEGTSDASYASVTLA